MEEENKRWTDWNKCRICDRNNIQFKELDSPFDLLFKCDDCSEYRMHRELLTYFQGDTFRNSLKEYSSDYIELNEAAIKDYRGKISKTIRKLSEKDSPVEIVLTEGMANGINFITYKELIKSIL